MFRPSTAGAAGHFLLRSLNMAKFKTGARPTPRHKLQAAFPHRLVGTPPPQIIVVPSFLEMWLNDSVGDCVTAEEAFAKAAYSVMMGQPETKITDATVQAFCDKFGFLNGANLTDVMDKMISDGFVQDGGYKDGPYVGVDYSNEAVLQDAISKGPVKIGIDSSALPSGAGNANGWYASGGSPGQFSNEDHSTALCGYGPSAALFQALGVPVPAGFPATGYLHYTWSTIGVVDHAWIMSTCGEAWLRQPTTPGVGPTPPPPPPPVCPAGQHWDPVAMACVPDGPNPPPPPPPTIITSTGTVHIPALAVPGLFGHVSHTTPIDIPVTVISGAQAGGESITLPPFLLKLLHLLCTGAIIIPPPWGPILMVLCGFLPANHAALAASNLGATITLPPWLINGLRFACSILPVLGSFLPPQFMQILTALCAAIPPQAGAPCVGCK
jgi:hypothetical protein